jgi:hypothetical protein
LPRPLLISVGGLLRIWVNLIVIIENDKIKIRRGCENIRAAVWGFPPKGGAMRDSRDKRTRISSDRTNTSHRGTDPHYQSAQ